MPETKTASAVIHENARRACILLLQLGTYGNAGRGFLQPFVNKKGGHKV